MALEGETVYQNVTVAVCYITGLQQKTYNFFLFLLIHLAIPVDLFKAEMCQF